jgi:hypothetical protein
VVFGQHNRVEGNNATGNGTLNLTPSCRSAFFDFDAVDNTWTGNAGTFGCGNPHPMATCPS